MRLNNPILKVSKRTVNTSTSRSPDAVFIEKSLENPIIVVPEKNKVDMIGPPNSISNLRPIIRQRLLHETPLQQKLRELQDETQAWNEKFWSEHNTKFIKEKESYIKSRLNPDDERKTLTADEMSEFYKAFLDYNWKTHVKYNFEWYSRNLTLLFLALKVNLGFTR